MVLLMVPDWSATMNSREVLDLAEAFEKATGKSSEDMDALYAWIAETKGAKALKAFKARLAFPL